MPRNFLLSALLLFFIAQISAKFIKSDPFFGEETDEADEADAPDTEETDAPDTDAPETEETDAPDTDAPETEETDAPETDAPETEAPDTDAPETDGPETDAPETEKPKQYDWKEIYDKCMKMFDDQQNCCDFAEGGDECLGEETTTEGPEYSDEAFRKCREELQQSKENCCYIFEDRHLTECIPQQTTPIETTTIEANAEEFERCKSVCYLDICCELFDYDLKECDYLTKKGRAFERF